MKDLAVYRRIFIQIVVSSIGQEGLGQPLHSECAVIGCQDIAPLRDHGLRKQDLGKQPLFHLRGRDFKIPCSRPQLIQVPCWPFIKEDQIL